MPVPSTSIAADAKREFMPRRQFGRDPRPSAYTALQVGLCKRVNAPDLRGEASTPNLESAFSRIYPMNPEPAPPTPNRESALWRI